MASDIRNLLLHAQLVEANATLHEAGKFAGLQQVVIEKQGAAISEALFLLEQAHTTAHQGDLLNCMEYVAQAMEILANDD